jgi:hypothetical protein
MIWGLKMSGKWFSNRGQMIQVACAVIAVAIGIVVQWNQLSVAINFGEILKVLLYPIVVLIAFRLGISASSRPAAQIVMPPPAMVARSIAPEPMVDPHSTLRPEFDYQLSLPVIKVGSYLDVNQELGLRRISVVSIKTVKTGNDEEPAAEIEVTGYGLDFVAGRRLTEINRKKALIPAYTRDWKDADCSMFDFTYKQNDLSFRAISVDHINVPAQEVTLVICLAKYRNR